MALWLWVVGWAARAHARRTLAFLALFWAFSAWLRSGTEVRVKSLARCLNA